MSSSVVRDEVTRYALDTKHRPHQYETPQQISHVMRKMLASHIRAVPWNAVYLHVSPGDYHRVVQRIAPMDLGQRVPPPAEFYAQLPHQVERSQSNDKDGIYAAFCEHIYPELKKVPYERSPQAAEDQKKALAIFLSKATNGDTRRVINLLYPAEETRDERERVYDATINYGPLKHEHDSEEAVARELGYFVRTMHFPDVESGKLYIVEPTPEIVEPVRDAPPLEKRMSSSPITWTPAPKKDNTSAELDSNPSIQKWKELHALGATFPSHKAAKQMLAQYHAPHDVEDDNSHLLPALGKYQHPNDLLEGDAVREVVSEQDVAHAYKMLLDGSTPEALTALMSTPQVQSFVDQLVYETPRTQLEKLTQQDVLSLFMQSHYRSSGGVSKEFIKGLISLYFRRVFPRLFFHVQVCVLHSRFRSAERAGVMRYLHTSYSIFIGQVCVVCLDGTKSLNDTLEPCMHQYMCDECTDMVVAAKMACPLCRSPIDEVSYNPTHLRRTADLAAEKKFMEQWRAQYLDDLNKARGSKSATGWKGNGKLAASIKDSITDAMEEAAAATAGTERMLAASKKATTITVNEQSRYFTVGIKNWTHVYHYLSMEDLQEMVTGMEPMTEHELASWMPQVFWLLVHHVGLSNMEETMASWGILQKGRRRKKVKK